MKSAAVMVLFAAVSATALTGCASSFRNYLEKDTPQAAPTARSDLTMPPDLRLPAPGTTAAAPDPGAMENEVALTTPPAAPARTAPAAPAAPVNAATSAADSIYTQAGISLYKPDGTKKTTAELQQELQAYYIAQKKAKNPKYGTVFNIGNVFKDE